ncbi:MAG TPA: polyprenyl synthetase family protein [Bacteroidia bacterium]|nr:polyprenyl synthetase family protein [Bacteroidia bacterium]
MIPLPRLQELVLDGIQQLSFPNEPAALYDPLRYILSLGGKRMRPVLTLMGCDAFGGDVNAALPAALGVEVFHNFTLMHDDIMDNAPLRRSKPTVHTKWNSNIAILSGDAMFVESCRLVMQSPDAAVRQVMDVFTKTALEVCEGQQYDMDFESMSQVSIDQYIDMIRLKTAVLLGGSLKMGAIIAGANESDANHLYDFGVNLGVAFQLQDDILDVFGDADKFGKQVGGDILSNKKTFLLLTALNTAQGSTKDSLLQWIKSSDQPQEKVIAVTEIYNSLNVRDVAEKKMNELYDVALSHLDSIPVDDANKQPLKDLAASLMVRQN